MALVKCHECGNEVSTEAATCPKCGAKPRLKKESPLKTGLVVIVVIAVALMYMCSSPSDSSTKPEKAECKADDLQCVGEKGLSVADVYCKDKVERLASHSVKWTDEGMFDRKFSRFSWKDDEHLIVTYFGDKAQFQNAFGAYTNVVYACEVDVKNKKALSARLVSQGKLPER